MIVPFDKNCTQDVYQERVHAQMVFGGGGVSTSLLQDSTASSTQGQAARQLLLMLRNLLQ
jgi:hypothetical protein